MGRHNGIWSKIHEPIWDHAKTRRAAEFLAGSGIPPEYAAQVAVGALQRLTCWALRDGDTGHTGGLSDARLALVAWPESAESKRFGSPARTGNILREALRYGGFLEGDGAAEAIHDFADHCRDILGDRVRKRGKDAERDAAKAATKSPERPPTVGRPSGAGPRREAEAAEEAAAAASPLPQPAAAESPAADPPDPLAARLADRLRWGKPDTVAAMLAELRAEGTPEPWLVARIDATPAARLSPWDWAKAARQARPKASPVNDQERIVAQRSAESHAQRYREHLAAGREAQAASSWTQVVSFARDAGMDPETLRAGPLSDPGRAA